jgi:general secretion pathway protein D
MDALNPRVIARCVCLVSGSLLLQAAPQPVRAQAAGMGASSDSVSVRIVDLDLRAAVSLLARYLDRPVLVGATVGTAKVTLESARPIARTDVERVLRGLADAQGLTMTLDSAAGLWRIEPKAHVQSTPPTFVTPNAGVPGTAGLHVIRLRHARAADVAATVNALYGRAAALGELGARTETLNDQIRRGQQYVPPSAAAVSEPVRVISQQLSAENAIVPDAGSNSLLIRGTQSDLDLVRAAVDALDVRPLQVLIEVLIAEVRKDRSLSYGLGVDAPSAPLNGSQTISVGASQTGAGLGDFALRVMRRGTPDITATLRAAATRGDARIVSRPVLLAVNNESAEILVGSQRPFVQVQRSLPTEAPSRDQVVQYRDVGTRLIVRPTISGDGFVALQVTQEVNAATNETQFDAPVISTRTVQTRLVVRDSQTVVLGGLSDRQSDRSQGGVPGFASIPWIGGLFGRARRATTETEFFLFLTPRILKDDSDVERGTAPYNERAKRAEP